MYLIIGLGNPGTEYAHTRHNTGFLAIDFLRAYFGSQNFKETKKFFALTTTDKINQHKIILAKPLTYMNDSGITARALLDFYKLQPRQMIVIHDDKDIILGKLKVHTGRGSAGHNGIKSLIQHLGGNEFTRLRIGIAPADSKNIGVTSHFVLNNFTAAELSTLNTVFEHVAQTLIKIIQT